MKLWLRNIIYWILLCIITPIVFLLLLLSCPLPRRQRHMLGIIWPYSLLWILQHIVGLKYKVIGAENIPKTPSVICSKHQSGWETLALQVIFPMQVYISKRELFFIPFFGWGLWLMNTIGIKRSDPRAANEQIMNQGQARINKGFWIAIFPEGTRIKPGERGRYKHGAARIAKTLQIPLLPVAHNAGEFWPRNSFLKYPGEVTLVIGSPIMPTNEKGPEATTRMVEEWIEARQLEISGAGPFASQADKERRSSIQNETA